MPFSLKTKEMQCFSAFLLFSALGATRTRDPLLRKQVLYPLSYESQGRLCLPRLRGGRPRVADEAIPKLLMETTSLAGFYCNQRRKQIQGGEGGIRTLVRLNRRNPLSRRAH